MKGKFSYRNCLNLPHIFRLERMRKWLPKPQNQPGEQSAVFDFGYRQAYPKGLLVQKKSEAPSACEDAYSCSPQFKRYAVADGVSKSFFPAEWAKLLVEHFCHDGESINTRLFAHEDWQKWLLPIQEEWHSQITRIVTREKKDWLSEELARRSAAAATFVGLQLNPLDQERASWAAMIIGDSCLFHIREGELHACYLVATSNEFGNYPECLLSTSAPSKHAPRFLAGTAQANDVFLLATDALSSWMLRHYEVGNWHNTWNKLANQATWDDFYQFIRREQSFDREMRLEDDDITLVIVPVCSTAKTRSRGSLASSRNYACNSKIEDQSATLQPEGVPHSEEPAEIAPTPIPLHDSTNDGGVESPGKDVESHFSQTSQTDISSLSKREVRTSASDSVLSVFFLFIVEWLAKSVSIWMLAREHRFPIFSIVSDFPLAFRWHDVHLTGFSQSSTLWVRANER